MDECPLSLLANSPSMPNVPPLQSQWANVILLSWNGEGDSDHGDKLRIVEGFFDDEGIQGLDSLSLTNLTNTLT